MDTKLRVLHGADDVDINYSGSRLTEKDLENLAKELRFFKRWCPSSSYLSADVDDQNGGVSLTVKVSSREISFSKSLSGPDLKQAVARMLEALNTQVGRWREERFRGLKLLGATGARVLIIDDDPDAAKILEICFQKLGFQTQVMNSGFELIKDFNQIPSQYNLLAVDIKMPLLSGKATIMGVEQLISQSGAADKWRGKRIPLITFSVLPESQIEFPTQFEFFEYCGHIPKGLPFSKLEKSVKKIVKKINERGKK